MSTKRDLEQQNKRLRAELSSALERLEADGGAVLFVRWCASGQVPGGFVTAGLCQRNPPDAALAAVAHVRITEAEYRAAPRKWEATVDGFTPVLSVEG